MPLADGGRQGQSMLAPRLEARLLQELFFQLSDENDAPLDEAARVALREARHRGVVDMLAVTEELIERERRK